MAAETQPFRKVRNALSLSAGMPVSAPCVLKYQVKARYQMRAAL